MIRKPIYLFKNDGATGLDKVPVGSVIGIGRTQSATGPVQILAKFIDNTGVTPTTSVGEALELNKLERVGSQPHKFDEGRKSMTLRMDDIEQFVIQIKIDKLGGDFTLPLLGGETYNANIDWGDGSEENITTDTNVLHTYPVDAKGTGIWTIVIDGTLPAVQFGAEPTEALKLYKVLNLGKVGWTSMVSAFENCKNMIQFNPGKSDTQLVSGATNMLKGCTGLVGHLALPSLAHCTDFTSLVEDVSGVLSCSGLSTANGLTFDKIFKNTGSMLCISGLDTRNQTSTNEMFKHSSLTNPDNAAKGRLQNGSKYINRMPCPQHETMCLSTIGKNAGRYGYKSGVMGVPEVEFTSLNIKFFELSWSIAGDFIFAFGDTGETQIPNMKEILVVNNDKTFAGNFVWDATLKHYVFVSPRFGKALANDYDANNMRSICFTASGKPSMVIWYDFNMKVGIKL